MSSLADFLQRLFDHGEVALRARPKFGTNDRRMALPVLAAAFDVLRLDVAGPLITFDESAAFAAAQLVYHACWFLMSHDEPEREVEKNIDMSLLPQSAAQHLSADLVMRYLAQVHRRARALAADDRLTNLLTKILRAWPLSGVLSDVEEEPTTSLEFAGHSGLLLLYAERLARKPKPAWLPRSGRGREYVELAFQQAGQGEAALLLAAAGDSSLSQLREEEGEET